MSRDGEYISQIRYCLKHCVANTFFKTLPQIRVDTRETRCIVTMRISTFVPSLLGRTLTLIRSSLPINSRRGEAASIFSRPRGVCMGNGQESGPPQKQKWWRDRAIIVGIIGVVATIVVGVVTYWLTAGTVSREYQERVKAARNDIQAAVGRSVGEGKVPNKAKIQAVISSIERQYGIKQQDSERTEAVIDDIIERVLANEFLDAQRREELSSKLLAVRDEQIQVSAEGQPKQPPSQESKNSIPWEFAALAAGITAFSTAFVGWRLISTRSEGELYFRILIPMFAVILVTLTAALVLSLSPGGQELLKILPKR